MKKVLLGLVAASVMSVFSWAEDVKLTDSHPDRYTVIKGDTLWDISEKFLQNPWMWPEIWHVNPQIANPHLIYPNDVIKLIYLDGKARLTVERTVKLAPGMTKLSPSVRVKPLGEAIPAIPLDAINTFLTRSRVIDAAQLQAAPYVLAGSDRRLIVGAGDKMYARGNFPANVPVFGVYRRGETYIDPDTKEVLGLQALDIGTAKLRALDKDVATMAVTRTTEEIRIEDRLLPHEERSVDSTFYPSSPDSEIEGKIISVEGGVTQVGKLDVVALNRGKREGLEVGNVMAIYKDGNHVKDRVTGQVVALPDERAGLLMVFRTFEKLSYALVLEADRPLAISDKVRNP